MANSQKAYLGVSKDDRQLKMAAETGNTYISETMKGTVKILTTNLCFVFWGSQSFWRRGPRISDQFFYKFGSSSNMSQNLVMIDRAYSEMTLRERNDSTKTE